MFRRNTYLWSVIVIGAIVTTVGGTGIFAVFSDRATQGPNTIQSGAQPKAVDLQIAEGSVVAGAQQCGPWQDNLTTALWNESNVQPGDQHPHYLCVKNNGAAGTWVSASVLDLVNSDNACTGDEAVVDPNCGITPTTGQYTGDLGDVLQVEFQTIPCGTSGSPDVVTAGLASLTGTSLLVFADNSLTVKCLTIVVRYPSTTALSAIQAAQSDGVSWRFAFDAVAIE